MLVHVGLAGRLISTQIAGCHVQSFWFSRLDHGQTILPPWLESQGDTDAAGPRCACVENPSPLAQWIALLPSGEELEPGQCHPTPLLIPKCVALGKLLNSSLFPLL